MSSKKKTASKTKTKSKTTKVKKKAKITKAETKTKKKKSKSKDICFVIMPFGDWNDDYYSSIYCPAIEAAGLEPHRADDLYRPSTIVHDIWDYTNKAKIVVADLTEKNPNVLYELGLAHALAKPAILVAESIEDIPFDLRALRVIDYEKNAPDWGDVLRDKIETSIREVLASPLDSVLPAFLEVKATTGKKRITEHEKEMLEIKQDIDKLQREISRGRHLVTHRERIVREEPLIENPEEAEEETINYLKHNYPLSVIRRRLSHRGVPEEWLDKEFRELVRGYKR